MEMTRIAPRTSGLLYPLMVIAAVAVIVFSVLGMASIMGWMPRAMVGGATATAADIPTVAAARVAVVAPPAGPAFQCAECGVVESVRDIEMGGSPWSLPVAVKIDGKAVETTGL